MLAKRPLSRLLMRRRLLLIGAITAVKLEVIGGNRMAQPPASKAEAERHLERELIAYDIVDGTPYIDVEFGDTIRLDELHIDPDPMRWPPGPGWLWTGMWETISLTTDPASLGFALADGGNALFGQVTTPEIVTIEARFDDEWRSFDVAAPEYLISFEGKRFPTDVRWLVADGEIAWTTDVPALAPTVPVGR